jgi:hypothetical protein
MKYSKAFFLHKIKKIIDKKMMKVCDTYEKCKLLVDKTFSNYNINL